jgi:hypothetical protein
MRGHRSTRCLIVAVALLALLVVATTLGGVWHHHANSSSEANCPICHLNHQPIERPLASNRTPTLASVGPGPEPRETDFAPSLIARRIPARAPPAA